LAQIAFDQIIDGWRFNTSLNILQAIIAGIQAQQQASRRQFSRRKNCALQERRGAIL